MIQVFGTHCRKLNQHSEIFTSEHHSCTHNITPKKTNTLFKCFMDESFNKFQNLVDLMCSPLD